MTPKRSLLKTNNLWTILLVLLLLSCSIQKRTLNKGYFINWKTPTLSSKVTNQNISSTKDTIIKQPVKESLGNLETNTNSIAIEPNKFSPINQSKDLNKSLNKNTIKKSKTNSYNKKNTTKEQTIQLKNKLRKQTISPNSNTDPSIKRNATTTLSLGLLSIFIIPIIPALIMGAITLKKIKKSYSQKGLLPFKIMTIIGIVLAFTSLIYYFLLLSLMILLAGASILYLTIALLAIIVLFFTLLNI